MSLESAIDDGDHVEAPRLVGSDRVLAVLSELAAHPSGIGLDDLSRRLASSKPTVHRALSSLRKAGFAVQASRGVYQLGDEFLRLAFRFQDQRPDTARVAPLLQGLAAAYGETAHYAILDKAVAVPRNRQIGMDSERDREEFTVSEGGVVAIGKGAEISYS